MPSPFLLPVNLPEYFDAVVRVALGFLVWFGQSFPFYIIALALLGLFFLFLKK